MLETNIEDRKFCQNAIELFIETVLREFNFAHVEIPYAAYFKVFMDDLVLKISN